MCVLVDRNNTAGIFVQDIGQVWRPAGLVQKLFTVAEVFFTAVHAGAYFAGFLCCPETPGPSGLALFAGFLDIPSIGISNYFCTDNTINDS